MNMIHVVFLFLHQNVFNQKTLNRQTAYTIHGLMPVFQKILNRSQLRKDQNVIPRFNPAQYPGCDPSLQSCPPAPTPEPSPEPTADPIDEPECDPSVQSCPVPGCDPSLQSCPPAPTPEPSPEPAPVTTPLPTSSCDPSIQSCPPPVDSGGNPVCDPSEWTCASKTYAKVPIEGYSCPDGKATCYPPGEYLCGWKETCAPSEMFRYKTPNEVFESLRVYDEQVQGWGNIPMGKSQKDNESQH